MNNADHAPSEPDDGRIATPDELSRLVRDEIKCIAPEIDTANLPGDIDYRQDIGLDSMDFLALITAIEHRTDVGIPEIDYAEIATLDALVHYLLERLASVPHENE